MAALGRCLRSPRLLKACVVSTRLVLIISLLWFALALMFPWYYISRTTDSGQPETVSFQAWYQRTTMQQTEYYSTWGSDATWQVRVVYLFSWFMALLTALSLLLLFTWPCSVLISAILASLSWISIFSFVIGVPVAYNLAQTECIYGPCDKFHGSKGSTSWGSACGFVLDVVGAVFALAACLLTVAIVLLKRQQKSEGDLYREEERQAISFDSLKSSTARCPPA
eukprot:CAMPEP_0114624956 /NCGR_PEP_ID=MMETSP0168-20121206/11027_1 /TAXON_ID=95228 ORGANISM="Vannella sp., Strain DIVA3 517/6/12" /NCGR_SAMPLE_ID=MMETSP0168 /ASSEMBLY_ACC=CAM_ASM_000044 /LENGTH=223 /DNA_ID=CAMNT_0001836233 /DNA_START=1 /DNA_END=668 /DNA_ORIENTATION=+